MATKRRTIGDNPLDALVPTRGNARAAMQASRRKLAPAGTTPRPEKRVRVTKKRLTVHVPVELVDAVKDAVVALSGPPLRLTLAHLAEAALRRELERLQKEHAKGKPFPKRTSELKGGRPIGT
jgi:hypothetical protein